MEGIQGDLVGTWHADVEPYLELGWRRLAGRANTRILATADELAEIEAKIEGVLAPFVLRKDADPADVPTGARGIRILRHVLPERDAASGVTSLVWDRRFSTYWFGQSVSRLGDRVSELALPLIAVTTMHASPTAVGLVTAAIWTPNITSLFVGAWVDQRPSKRRLLVAANLVQAGAVVSLPVAFAMGWLSMWLLYVVALLLGAGGVLYNTAYPTFFAHLVRRDQYVEANSFLSTTRSGSFIIGPAVGGALIQAVTAPVAMVTDAVSFLVSAVAIDSVKVDEAVVPSSDSPWTTPAAGLDWAALPCPPSLPAGIPGLRDDRELLLVRRRWGDHPVRQPHPRAVGRGNRFRLWDRRIRWSVGRPACRPCRAPHRHRGHDRWRCGPVLRAVRVDRVRVRDDGGEGGRPRDRGVRRLGRRDALRRQPESLQTAVTPDAMRSRAAGAYSMVNYGIRPFGAVVGGVMAETVGIRATLVVAAVGGALSFLWLLQSPVITTRSVADLEPVGA